MQTETRLTFDGSRAHVETQDPHVVSQLEELPEAEVLGEGRFSLPAEIARIHFPHLAA